MPINRQPAIRAGSTGLTVDEKQSGFGDRVTDTIMNLISKVPPSSEISGATPDARARQLARNAARTSASISGGAALAPGPLGMLTLLPLATKWSRPIGAATCWKSAVQ